MTRAAARLLVVAVAAAAMTAFAPAPAALARCEGTVTAVRPDGTPVGWFVSPPEVGPDGSYPTGDPLTDKSVSWADTYGYSARWNTYDLGCGPDAARDPLALAFTAMANLVAEGAKFPIVVVAQLQTWLTGDPFGWLNDFVGTVSHAIRDHVWVKLFPLSLIGLGLVLVWQSRRADFSAALSAAGWCLMVLTISVFFVQYPQKASATMTSVVQSGASVASAPFDGGSFTDTLTRHVIYPQWLQGELGSTTSAVAKQYGADLYRAQHYTWAESQVLDRAGAIPWPGSLEFDDADRAAYRLQKSKETDFSELADKVKASDRDAYANLQGKNGVNRLAAAFIMGLYTWSASLFMILALAILALALLMVFAVVLAAPLAGIVGLHDRFRHVFKAVLNMFVAAVVGVVKLTLAAGVFSVVVAAIVVAPGNQALKLLLTIIATVVAIMVVRPIKTFKTVLPGVDPHISYVRQASDYLLHRKAVEDGIEEARASEAARDVDDESRVSSTRAEQQSMDPIPDDRGRGAAAEGAPVFADDPDRASVGGPPSGHSTRVLTARSSPAPDPDSRQRADGAATVERETEDRPRQPETTPQQPETTPQQPETTRHPWTPDPDEPIYRPEREQQSTSVDDLPIADAQIGDDGEEVFVVYRTRSEPYEIPFADLREPATVGGDAGDVDPR